MPTRRSILDLWGFAIIAVGALTGCAPPATSGDAGTGASCVQNADCEAALFCKVASGSACGSVGTCQPRPGVCPDYCVAMACGCDGNRYCNECFANGHGTNLGPCGAL